MQNTHGAAFVDEEARLATRGFRRENCVRCHTPRPVFETGFEMTPVERRHDLEEGNTCMSCHGKAGYDYRHFHGGAECKVAFDDRVGTARACATCHRIAGTPGQWAHAANGKLAGNRCVDCHMPLVERPVAVGTAPRLVRAHVFPASRSESQLRSAYGYDVRLEGDEVVATITNRGAGHNFSTGSVQRSIESLIVVRDAEGKAVVTDREVMRLPYAKPYGTMFPRSTQLPSGASREHRVPIPVAGGTVECELFFKRYYPVRDGHPTLSRRLEWRKIPFEGRSPSLHVVVPLPGHYPGLPEVTPAQAARPDGLAKYAYPAPGTARVALPSGDSPQDVARLVALLQYPLPGARAEARSYLLALGPRVVPPLVEGLGHWSDETRNECAALLRKIGTPAALPLLDALDADRLYPRYEARGILATLTLSPGLHARLLDHLVADVARRHPLDRRSAADALGELGDPAAAPALRGLLADPDPDVVTAAAHALARLDDRASVLAMEAAFERAHFVETRRDLASALASLGSAAGVPMLLDTLDYRDDVIRRTCFDALFAATGLYESYDPGAPRADRREAMARLQSAWAQAGGSSRLRPVDREDPAAYERAWPMVEALGGGSDTKPGGDDTVLLHDLVAMGPSAVPALIEGLTFPVGWVNKRALVCEALAHIGDPRAAPYLIRVLRDPDLRAGTWACYALSSTADAAAIPALRRWSRRLRGLIDDQRPAPAPEDLMVRLARAAWTRSRLGDPTGARELETLGVPADVASSPPPSLAVSTVPTAEAPPVPVPTSPEDAVAKARVLRAKDFYEDAVRVLYEADRRFGTTPEVRLETAWNLLMIGEEDVTRDADPEKIAAEVAEARTVFDEVHATDPDLPGESVLEAKILRYEGHGGQARALLETTVAAHPDDAAAHRAFGDFAAAQSDWATAAREYAALATLHPEDPWASLYATIARHWTGDTEDLEAAYLDAVRRLPEERVPLDRLAALYDDVTKDVALLERVVAQRPGSVEARVVLAGLLLRRDPPDREEAGRRLREALALDRRAPAPHLGYASLLATDGRYEEAIRHDLDALVLVDRFGIGEPSAALDGLLRDPRVVDAVPEALRRRAWDVLVARRSDDARYARDAGLWYLDVAGDSATGAHFLAMAVAYDPTDTAARDALARARSGPSSEAHDAEAHAPSSAQPPPSDTGPADRQAASVTRPGGGAAPAPR